MKTKKFDYGKWGADVVKIVEMLTNPMTKRGWNFWDGIKDELLRRTDCVYRRPEQWRRIYAECKRREKVREEVEVAEPRIVAMKYVSGPNHFGQVTIKIYFNKGGDDQERVISQGTWNYIDKLQQNQKDILK